MKPTALVAQSAHGLGEPVSHPPADAARWPSDTPGGRFYAEWDSQAPVSREGQLMFLFQFLQAGDRWREFLRDCPLHCSGNRGSGSLNVMGAALLSILCGHWRYAHINAVRGDHVNAGLLGMARIVSEDIVRESPATAPVGENKRRRRDPFELRDNQGRGVGGHSAAPWSGRIAVLVTSLDERSYPTLCMPRQYRDRAAAEDNDDELKNQWGWCGLPRGAHRCAAACGWLSRSLTTQKLAPCRIMADLIALFYNWWNLYIPLLRRSAPPRSHLRLKIFRVQAVGPARSVSGPACLFSRKRF